MLGVETESDGSRVVLPMRNGAWYSLGLEVIVETRLVLVGIILARGKGWDCAILLGLSPVKDVLVVVRAGGS